MKKNKIRQFYAIGMAWFLLAGVGILFSGCDQLQAMLGIGGEEEGEEEGEDDEAIAYKSYYVKATGNDNSAGTKTAPLATVTAALQKLAADYAAVSPAWPNEESGGIVILGTVNAKQIDITGAGYPHIVLAGGSGAAAGTLALSEAAADYLLMVREGASVSLRNITLKGWNTGGGSAAGFVRVGILGTNTADGTLRLESGAVVKDNNTEGTNGSGVVVYHGHFIMEEGSEISGNTGTIYGGGVYVHYGATFTMNGGTIKGNKAGNGSYGGGGGVFVGGGTFTMNGGTISGNTATNSGGGVWLDSTATFSKTGGIIYGNDDDDVLKNTATNGHAVYVATTPATSYDTTLGETDNYPPTP
ncbi:MAG: hypothetical protein LBD86_02305 [Spirochaetaceae bacterium]|jgi:hypothetical protein|nr:hypothetical protein [Spirochaetaceae bacterium]